MPLLTIGNLQINSVREKPSKLTTNNHKVPSEETENQDRDETTIKVQAMILILKNTK